jgi:3-hydroxyacyl-CoA dehydrogenase/enoyl-CoA hydratase/3-hydroxybutyryl-CoA epimerase
MTTAADLLHWRFGVDDDGVATAALDRAGTAMNTLSPDVMRELDAIVGRCETDPDVRGLVVTSAKGDNFLAGADIGWLEQLDAGAVTSEMFAAGQGVLARLEALHARRGMPVVAAIHGACLGGGLELALACGTRIASDDEQRTQLGQPEVRIGLIPGAGATQRLPSLVGIAAALDLILTGRSVRPRRALAMGLVDALCPKEALPEAARSLALAPPGGPGRRGAATTRLRDRMAPSRLGRAALEGTALGRRIVFRKAEAAMLAATRGNYPAPPAALRAVRTGVEQGEAAGYAAEVDEFTRLVGSPEAGALISLFLATQELRRDTGAGPEAQAVAVDKVGVVGGGLMGAGIAAVTALEAGVHTRIKEVNDEAARRGLAHVRRLVDERTSRRRLTPSGGERAMSLVTATTGWEGFSNADLVIEAVFEDLTMKHGVLRQIEAVTGEQTIFATNTSSIPIADIAEASERPSQVIGMHYFSPVEKMPLLEVVVSAATADWVTATCVAFGKRQGKTVIVVGDGPGFYTSRAIAPYMSEAMHLVAEGVAVDAIDRAMVAWGFPVGPMTLADEVGIDVGAKVADVLEEAFGARLAVPHAFSRLVKDGRTGRKSGSGFYRYEDGAKGDVDESVYEVLGVDVRATAPNAEIQERLGLRLVNEAARCLEEGILRSARDGDIGAVMGLGFPPFRGGPFTYVDQQGATTVVGALRRLEDRHGARFTPAAILVDAAENGTRLR